MAELDSELLEKVARWCAEAGRQAGAGEIRAALGPLGWDELLAVRALLADPPPARPLGPQALADVARGTPADVAAERERAGRYRHEDAEREASTPAAADAAAPVRRAKGARRAAPAAVVVRRARDRAPAEPAQAPAPPLLDELQLPGGRAVLERLIRRHGGRRAVIAAAVAAGWRRADGGEVGEEDVATLLELHGLARPFERRERDELLHALRAAGGVRSRAAERVGLDAARLEAALRRVGAERAAEEIRGERRAELRARATLTERVRLLLDDPERLQDLGLLEEIEADLRRRLPEHLRALRAGPAPLRPALAASLSLEGSAADALAERFGLDLGPGSARERSPARGAGGWERAARPGGAGRPPRTGPSRRPSFSGSRPDRPAGDRGAPATRQPFAQARPERRPGAPGPAAGRPFPRAERPPRGAGATEGGARPAFSRPGSSVPGGPPSRPRTGPAGRGPRTRDDAGAPGARSGTPRPGGWGPPRSGPPRSGPPRSGPPRSGPPRSGPPRSGPPRSGPPRSGPPRSGPPRSGPPRSGPPRGRGPRRP